MRMHATKPSFKLCHDAAGETAAVATTGLTGRRAGLGTPTSMPLNAVACAARAIRIYDGKCGSVRIHRSSRYVPSVGAASKPTARAVDDGATRRNSHTSNAPPADAV